MIAVRVLEPVKVAVVGAPSYFAEWQPPRTPDESHRHSPFNFVEMPMARCSNGCSSGRVNPKRFRWRAG